MILTDNDIYYLKSIKKNLDELKAFTDMTAELKGFGLVNVVHADNRDWLDCFIDKHERSLPKEKE